LTERCSFKTTIWKETDDTHTKKNNNNKQTETNVDLKTLILAIFIVLLVMFLSQRVKMENQPGKSMLVGFLENPLSLYL
jgi:hypothetical protein